MATAPTRNLGYALASGLGAGVGEYQNLRKYENVELPQVTTNRMQAQADLLKSGAQFAGNRYTYLGNGTWRDNVGPRLLTNDEHDAALHSTIGLAPFLGATRGVPLVPDIKTGQITVPAAGNTVAPPTQSSSTTLAINPPPQNPDDIIYSQVDETPGVKEYKDQMNQHLALAAEYTQRAMSPDLIGTATADAYLKQAQQEKALADQNKTVYMDNRARQAQVKIANLGSINQANIARNVATQNAAYTDANAALETYNNATEMRNRLFDPKTGKPTVSGGPLGPHLVQAGALFQQLGMDPDVVQSLIGTNPNNATEVAKLQASLGAEMARLNLPGGPVRVGEFNKFLGSVPGPEMPARAAGWILDNVILPQSKNRLDAYEHISHGDLVNGNSQADYIAYKKAHPWSGNLPSAPAGVANAPSAHRVLGSDGHWYTKRGQ